MGCIQSRGVEALPDTSTIDPVGGPPDQVPIVETAALVPDADAPVTETRAPSTVDAAEALEVTALVPDADAPVTEARAPSTVDAADALETTVPALDAGLYPHIFEAIVAYAPTASLVVLRQTCRHLRDLTRPMLFHHVVFVPVVVEYGAMMDDRVGEIHVRTGVPPHLYLGRFRIRRDYPLHAQPELRRTRVLDVYEFPSIWKEALDQIVLNMPHLRNVRHLYNLGALGQFNGMVSADWDSNTHVHMIDFPSNSTSIPSTAPRTRFMITSRTYGDWAARSQTRKPRTRDHGRLLRVVEHAVAGSVA
jgi:hypothetical protein